MGVLWNELQCASCGLRLFQHVWETYGRPTNHVLRLFSMYGKPMASLASNHASMGGLWELVLHLWPIYGYWLIPAVFQSYIYGQSMGTGWSPLFSELHLWASYGCWLVPSFSELHPWAIYGCWLPSRKHPGGTPVAQWPSFSSS